MRYYLSLLTLFVLIGCDSGMLGPDEHANSTDIVESNVDGMIDVGSPSVAPSIDALSPESTDVVSLLRVKNTSCIAPERPDLTTVGLQSVLERAAKRVDMRLVPEQKRFFVAENSGIVKSYSIDDSVIGKEVLVEEGVLLNIEDRVEVEFEGVRWAEMGLLGLAIDPDFNNNGYIYVYYSANGTVADSKYEGRLSRFRSDDGGLTASADTEEVLIRIDHSVKGEHWGGGLAFDENMNLYFSVGDAADSAQVQSLDSYLGKILRIDVRSQSPYGIPVDNPFVDSSYPEIYALGFRNPWRISYDSSSRRLIAGDVGQADWEEINNVTAAGNYGWPLWEGARCTVADGCSSDVNVTMPSHSYAHENGSAAVIGGFIYRGQLLQEYYGKYFYGDAVSGNIYAVDLNDPDSERELVANTDSVFSFAVGHDNELYVLGRNSIKKMVRLDKRNNSEFPTLLSDTGCFVAADPSTPEKGLFRYDVNAPLWSDGAEKDRWFALPDHAIPDTKIKEGGDGVFEFPVGSVIVKNFSLLDTKVETRFLVRHDDGDWGGYTYQWYADQTDAVLLEDRKTVDFGNVSWTYPSRTDCFQCHSKTVGVLGLESGQINRTVKVSGETKNQLSELQNAGYLMGSGIESAVLVDPSDETANLLDRAKSYLHSNCSGCHSPDGIAPGNFDFRYATKLVDMGILPLDITNAPDSVVEPGNPENSVLLHRLRGDDNKRMPPLSTTLLDYDAIELFEAWIASMEPLQVRSFSNLDYPEKNGTVNGQFTMKGSVSTNVESIRLVVFDINQGLFFGDVATPFGEQWFFTSPDLVLTGSKFVWELPVDLPEGRYRVNVRTLAGGEGIDLTSFEFNVSSEG